MYAKPTIKGKPAPRYYRFQDMEVVWRADGSILYKSDRLKHYMIHWLKATKEDINEKVVAIMFENRHSKEYPISGYIEVLPLNAKDRFSLKYEWNPTTHKFDIDRKD